MAIKLGILLPRSDMYPRLALDFVNGFKHALSMHPSKGAQTELVIESAGTASNENLLKSAEKLLLQDNVDAVISFCGMTLINQFIALFNNYRKPLLHIDIGSSYLKKENKSPYVLHVTLGVCQASYLAGAYAAKNYGKKGYSASSVYDGAYHLTESFVRGYASEGGAIDKFYVSPMDYKSETFETLVDDINAIKPDVIFATFSYKEGQKVFNVLAKDDRAMSTPIVAIPLMTEECTISESLTIENVVSMASWSFNDETEAMKTFQKEFEAQYDDAPNIISLLGYEAGLTLMTCISSEEKLEKNLEAAIKNKTIDSPRGKILFNSLNESQPEAFLLRKLEFINNEIQNNVVETFDVNFLEGLYSEFEEVAYTGWHNPYICT
ncbi:ABC transporter substrate-binding protein [Rasiella rasia]|uniref:ABC transporter substrate-binding protein n=1 Tax=Rasiella rasia TaxID=2744027 RepID=A0A6G6GI82_9FLAO|nr:ABC transporter substrate-binding protein [Rasiella rasia]QIE58285.1 ABC transporter substrate-binding protein [Rasiella rasia]